ncbi:DNA-binding transcriptional LysR family regulator [Herbihabitans rhizosphaerae]|uniref:DNA-binding transcriptional LysR family regulator n=1 Tax=Herbihabitans rhizosphaerae TaxID=1872711 RepID=A0A4Q7KAT9_9PSEU|nr:LysR family transcriptional regulator [Herbihabitans rhizosphaerae]RZS29486.1 DNA-binding transcriptional LysR family regulator [Herbihabitans rhizosphaerae]
MDLDIGAVRAFVAVAEDRYFGEAAVRLEVSQQAISKRIAKLESDLGATLLTRTRGGAELTEEGHAFLPHARALVGLADQAVERLRVGRRPLRVDVLSTRIATMELIRSFHEVHDVELELVTVGLGADRTVLLRDTVDAAFARATGVPAGVERIPACLDGARLLVGKRHPLARRRRVPMAEVARYPLWMPNNVRDSEWKDYYLELRDAFGVEIDTSGPNFGGDHYVQALSESTDRVGFIGEKMRVLWHPDVVQIPIVDPTPVYPFWLLWRPENRHPVLPLLIEHVRSAYRPLDPDREWLPPGDRPDFLG